MVKRTIIYLACLTLFFTACDKGTSGLPECDGLQSDRDNDGIMDSAYIFEIYSGEPYYDSIVNQLKSVNAYDCKIDCIETGY